MIQNYKNFSHPLSSVIQLLSQGQPTWPVSYVSFQIYFTLHKAVKCAEQYLIWFMHIHIWTKSLKICVEGLPWVVWWLKLGAAPCRGHGFNPGKPWRGTKMQVIYMTRAPQPKNKCVEDKDQIQNNNYLKARRKGKQIQNGRCRCNYIVSFQVYYAFSGFSHTWNNFFPS